ncbi:hypothetical protein BH09BAC6_BH09BAC6_03300 [soil metagenome]|jgi:hypothetical protein
MKVMSVTALPEYKLQITFDDGVSGTIDLKSFVNNGIFSVLKDEQCFSHVYTNGYSIAWSDELEIDATTIYAEILNKSPEEVLAANFKYATN